MSLLFSNWMPATRSDLSRVCSGVRTGGHGGGALIDNCHKYTNTAPVDSQERHHTSHYANRKVHSRQRQGLSILTRSLGRLARYGLLGVRHVTSSHPHQTSRPQCLHVSLLLLPHDQSRSQRTSPRAGSQVISPCRFNRLTKYRACPIPSRA